jgi:hypothetical protein
MLEKLLVLPGVSKSGKNPLLILITFKIYVKLHAFFALNKAPTENSLM